MKRFTLMFTMLCVVLAVCLLTVPTEAQATTIASGNCGANGGNATWVLDDTGCLTISGEGSMKKYTEASPAPWYDIRGSIKDVVINDGIINISAEAFKDCANLVSVTIPESVISVNSTAFSNCAVKKLIIADDCEAVTADMIICKETLQEVIIPDSVQTIDEGALSGCSNLKSLTIPFVGRTRKTATDSYQYPFGSIFGWSNYTGSTATTQKYHYYGSSSFNESTYYIPTNLTSVTVTGGNILYGAFYNCTNLKSLAIGSKVTSIEQNAFYNCTNLEDLYVMDVSAWCNVSFYNSDANPMKHADRIHILDEDGKEATDIVLDQTVTKIPDFAFYGCTELTSITFSNSVTSIGRYAFYGCTGLKSLNIPDSVTTIGEWAFYDCIGLTKVVLGNGVGSIGTAAFYECTSLEELTISDSVTSLDTSSFHQCPIKKLIIAESSEKLTSAMIVSKSTIEDIVIPDSVNAITDNDYTLKNCTALKNIYISDLRAWCEISFATYGSSIFDCADNLYLNGTLVKELTIPEGTTAINSYAFRNYKHLTSVTIPASVSAIGYFAFEGCTGLTCITIPGGVTNIGSNAFNDCTGITDVYIADASAWCKITDSGASYLALNTENVHVLDAQGNEVSQLVLDDSVTRIPAYAFANCKNLQSVVIPESVTSIGEGAFHGCTNLESITIPFVGNKRIQNASTYDQKYTIGYIFGEKTYADAVETAQKYYNGSYWEDKTYYIPASLKSVTVTDDNVGNYAFYNCIGLTNISFGDGVTSIGEYALSNCIGLTDITILNNITWIREYAFRGCSGLTSIIVPDSVTTIGGGAFSGCSNLESMTIPVVGYFSYNENPFGHVFGAYTYDGSVATEQTIYYSSGSGSYKQTYYIPTSLKSVTVTGGDLCKAAFQNCSGLTNITLGKDVKSIGESAFYGCSSLEEITIFSNISDRAFYGCTELTKVTIGDGVTSIGDYAFNNCTNLTSITIPDSVKSIGYGAFSGCTGLTSVTIGSGITSIGGSAFYGCVGIEELRIPDINIWCMVNFGDNASNPMQYAQKVYVGNNTTPGIKDIVLNNTVTKISSYAFQNCTELISVTIPDSATTIGEYAFLGCSIEKLTIAEGSKTVTSAMVVCKDTLKEVVLPEGLTTIGDSAFKDCAGLTEIDIPDSVTTIGNSAFYGCTGLTEIMIPGNVESIGEWAFYYCSELEELYIADVNAWCMITFGNHAANPMYYANLVHILDKDGNEVTNVVLDETVTKISAYAFYQCNTLTSIVIPNSVKSIGQYAFYQCTRLKSATIPDQLESVGSYAFVGTRITSVILPDTVNSIGEGAFSGCTYLITAVISDNVSQLGYYTFNGCSSLKSVVLGSNIRYIYPYAFYNCSELTQVFYRGTNDIQIYEDTQMSNSGTNWNLRNATWHRGVEFAVFAEQDCIYCPECNDYLLLDGSRVMATVIFKDWDGTVLSENTYHYGDVVTAPANPTRAADETYTYAFKSWDEVVVNCTANATYTATYTATYINYTVVFKNWNGTVLSTKTYHYGDVVTAPANPTRAADNIYTYTFNGWDDVVGNCTGDAVYMATYAEVYIDYTVVFKNWNGTVISTKTYHWGDTISTPNNPVKETDHIGAYTFAGWDRDITSCEGDAIYTATYTMQYIDYTIVFKDWDGNTLSTETYHYGEAVTAPANPVKTADHIYTYAFAGWDKTVASCAGDATYIATYTSTYIDYTIIFKNWDGTILVADTYHYGESVDAPANPTRIADNIYTYTFASWDKTIVACEGDATYTARYTPMYINYTVVFKDWDGTVLSTKTYYWDEAVIEPTSLSKAADHIGSYTFAGWDVDVATCCNGNAIYTAIYTTTYIDYIITFKNWDGSEIGTITCHYGDAVTAPANPTRPGDDTYVYTFTGWDKTVVACNGDAVYTAVYSKATRVPSTITSTKYTVNNGIISNIGTGTTVSVLVSNLNEGEYVKIYNGTKEVTGNTLIGTGMVVKIMDGNTVKASVTIVVTGDTNGDGKISVTDYVQLKSHLLNKSLLTGAAAKAADTSGDGKPTVTDYVQMKAHILGKSTVQPRSAVTVVSTSTPVAANRNVEPAQEPVVTTLNYMQIVTTVPEKKILITL